MKLSLTLLLLITGYNCFAQQITYTEWKEKAKTEINLQPEYGNLLKDKEHIAADDEFIKTVLRLDSTREKGSVHLVKLGFSYLYRGDLQTAMYRFNQACLLNPKNENAYWGYASVYFTFNDTEEALRQLEKGLAINPNSSNILTDKATIYMSYYANNHHTDDLNKAIALFSKSHKIDPSNQNTLFKLSAAYFYMNDCTNAWKYYNECMKLGGTSISPGYADALRKQCKP